MRTVQITLPPKDNTIEAIINCEYKSFERMPDHRFREPYEGVAAIHPELKAQIELLIYRIRQVTRGDDPIIKAYKANKLFIEEVSDPPADFRMESLLRSIDDERATSGVHPSGLYDASLGNTYGPAFSRKSVIGYAFMNAEGTSEPFELKDEAAYTSYRMKLSGGRSFQFVRMTPYSDMDGIKRGFPLLFLMPTNSHPDRFFATRAEHHRYYNGSRTDANPKSRAGYHGF